MMKHSFTFRKIRHTDPLFAQVYALREQVLRVPLGLSLAQEDLSGDAEDDIFIILQEAAVVACLMSKPLADAKVKFRQMAVAPELQGQGIGKMLMMAAEADVAAQGRTGIMLHARSHAVPFYTRLGYQGSGAIFEEVGIAHLLMEKPLVTAG